MEIIKKILAAFLSLLQLLFAGGGGKNIEPVPGTKVTPVYNESAVLKARDGGESPLFSTVAYASGAKNQVQAIYTDSARNAYAVSGQNTVFTHKLTGKEKTASLTDRNGGVYFENTFRTYYKNSVGIKRYFEDSKEKARVNTVRLGEYYYDCHIRDLKAGNLKIDKELHAYADKFYMEYSLLADMARFLFGELGSEISVRADRVNALEITDKNGKHESIEGVDASSVEYVAFDIADIGIAGIIVPADGKTAAVTVEETDGVYTVRQTAQLKDVCGINKYDEKGGFDSYRVNFGFRLYTDATHDFSGIEAEVFKERNPLELTLLSSNAEARVLGYEPLRGTYTVEMDGTAFQWAYDNPDERFTVTLQADGDNLDRNIILRTTCPKSGCIESGVLLDENDLLMPVDVQVCKNFQGDGGDTGYSYNDYAYGDTFTPITVEGGSQKKFTLVNLYQNWGKFPLKQLSSIEFHVSYYHLSTGTTESNCIAPYFVFDKDGWTLPDFRTASGVMWQGQPQFNSVGILKFLSRRDAQGKAVYSEFTGSKIHSYGPTYADVTDSYTADDGAFRYTLRHTEYPETDENRTYYTVDVEFLEDVTYENFREDFDLFYFDGRFTAFNKLGYLAENNERVNAEPSEKTAYHVLGGDHPFFGFYSVTEETSEYLDGFAGCNFALLIRDSEITVGGERSSLPFVFRESGDKKQTVGCLTLDADELSFRKGDTIRLELILLPWGKGTEENDDTVWAVREDSALKPQTVVKADTEYFSDGFVPVIEAKDNEAEFTLTGGRGNLSVRVDGFTSMKKPQISVLKDGQYVPYEFSSVHGYDGYMIRVNDDGTFSVSFVYEAESPDAEVTFRISN